jgi:Fur family ferric uptake transcriptional regulator
MPLSPKWKRRFKENGFRWTITRKAILDLLSGTTKHMSAQEIYDTLLESYPGIGMSTVYRTLDLLSRMCLVNKINIGEDKNRYEYRSDEGKAHHHHLICTNCGKIIDYCDFLDYELDLVKKIEKNLSRKYSFLVKNHNIDFYGLCKDCK